MQVPRQLTIAEAIREALAEEMERDPSVFLIGEDIGTEGGWGGPFTVTLGLADRFGHERVRDTPISEAAIIGAAVGAAMNGMRPVAEVQYSDFLFVGMDQIVNQMAKMRYMSAGQLSMPLVLRAPTGATGRGAQHAQSPEAYFLHTPGIKVATPSNPYDAKGLLKSSIRDDNPVMFFEHKLLYGSSGARSEKGAIDATGEVPDGDYTVPIGKAEVKKRGDDVTVVANLLMVHESLGAARDLEDEGISAEVIDLRTLAPMDTQAILDSVSRTGNLAIVEEDTKSGGWGAEVAARVAELGIDFLDGPIVRVATPDLPIPAVHVLEKSVIPSRDVIADSVRNLLA
jgi:pyruvate dehydrogenase E1 component beta subunit